MASKEPDNAGDHPIISRVDLGMPAVRVQECNLQDFLTCIYTSFGRRNMRILQKMAMEVGTVRRAVLDKIRAKLRSCTLNFTDQNKKLSEEWLLSSEVFKINNRCNLSLVSSMFFG